MSGAGTVRLAPREHGDEPVSQKIVTGASDGKNVEIVSGLAEGDRVLRTVYRLPEQKSTQGFSLLPRPTHMRGSASPRPSPPPQ